MKYLLLLLALCGSVQAAYSPKMTVASGTVVGGTWPNVSTLFNPGTEEQDPDNAYLNGVFTCPSTGTYGAAINLDNYSGAATQFQIILKRDTTAIRGVDHGSTAVGQFFTLGLTAIVPCNQGQTLSFFWYSASGTTNYLYGSTTSAVNFWKIR